MMPLPLRKAFKPKPNDAPRKEQTEAQRRATDRNFTIFKLRGLWSQAGMLAEPYRTTVRALIDADLMSRGARSSVEQELARYEERRRRRARNPPPPDPEDDIPF